MCIRDSSRRVADPFVGQQPHLAAMVGARWEAADQVRVGIGNDAWQHAQPEPRAHARQQAGRGRMVHRHPVLQAQLAQPSLIMDPQLAAAAADNGVLLQILAVARNPMGGGIFRLALIERTEICLLYTSPSPRDGLLSRMPSSA